MRAVEGLVEELQVQLLKRRPFEPIGAGQAAVVCCRLHRAPSVLCVNDIRVTGTQELSTEDFLVELHVVRDQQGRLVDICCDGREDGLKIDSISQRELGGDAVDLCGIVGDDEAFGLYYVFGT